MTLHGPNTAPSLKSVLPDVAKTDAVMQGKLNWVGMRGIDLPVQLTEVDLTFPLHARVDVEVNLPHPSIRGIHMSRLYLLLHSFAATKQLSPGSLTELLRLMVESHSDCQTTNAQSSWSFEVLLKRAALITPGLSGWRAYPVRLTATRIDGKVTLEAAVTVTYSSTCPCSAALARQIVRDSFTETFNEVSPISMAQVAAWLETHASVATPHSQRSVAVVRVPLASDDAEFGLVRLIDLIEASLQTPVQTAVKRIDEQAFARLNGANLMYVEDAARRVQAALCLDSPSADISVRHMESLHAHDATAQILGIPSKAFSGNFL